MQAPIVLKCCKYQCSKILNKWLRAIYQHYVAANQSFFREPAVLKCCAVSLLLFPSNTARTKGTKHWHLLLASFFVLWLKTPVCYFATYMKQGKDSNQRETNVIRCLFYVHLCTSCNERHSLFRYYVLDFPIQCKNLNRYRTKTKSSNDNRTLKW